MPIVHEKEVLSPTGKRVYGFVCTFASGHVCYFARRRHREIFRTGHSTISGAMTDDVAAWAIDEALLFSLRAKGVKLIGVRVIDTGEAYITNMKVFFDRASYKMRDYTGVGRGGSPQRFVPLQYFRLKKALVDLNADKLY